MVFAGVRGDGHVVTWGRARYGGDSAAVQEQLRDVQHISATVGAFATVLVVGGGLGPWAWAWLLAAIYEKCSETVLKLF